LVSVLWSSCDALSGRSSIYACRACNIRTPLRAIGVLSLCGPPSLREAMASLPTLQAANWRAAVNHEDRRGLR
jgi:hypothetical protein